MHREERISNQTLGDDGLPKVLTNTATRDAMVPSSGGMVLSSLDDTSRDLRLLKLATLASSTVNLHELAWRVVKDVNSLCQDIKEVDS